ncbi:MAG: Crp/Fnr family transcriptional regulator [Gammaproteobacteria bacterium]|nr:Crp/Fnr family transcriptional regulator [Gammaproteobacteria bacterium]MCK5091184.1 Crp/Fnr family transcriptional regulator [Gammaproteobacteria bacterium]
MSNIESFKNISLFNNLSEECLKILASHAVTKSYRKNTVVVNKGDETSSLYVVLEGSLKAYVDDDHEKEVILSIIDAGKSFGELSLLSDTPRSASVITTTHCKLAIISKQDFMECLTKNPSISFTIIQALIDKIHNLTEDVSGLALLDVYGRIVKTLNKNALEKDGKLTTPPLTHQEIANMIGSSREMVSKILKDLRKGGYISTGEKTITIERTLPSGW